MLELQPAAKILETLYIYLGLNDISMILLILTSPPTPHPTPLIKAVSSATPCCKLMNNFEGGEGGGVSYI